MSDAVVIGVLTITAGCVAGYFTARIAAAEWKGAADQKFIGIAKDLNDIDVEQDNQWKEIRRATSGVSRLSGEVSAIRVAKHQTRG